MCDLWDNIFMSIVAILILLAILFGCHLSNDAEWNDGKCSCGGSWQYEQAVGHQFYTMYIYTCDKCGRTEEFYKKR